MMHLATQTGVGLRAEHYQQVLEQQPAIAWLEVHSENYFGEGGLPLYYLTKIREYYPISLHGVTLSLGSADPLNTAHLKQLKQLIAQIEPCLVSDHLCWNSIDGHYYNELLPLPYTEQSLEHVIARISQVQDYLQRTLLIENISSYIQFQQSTIPEAEFLTTVAQRTGCQILLDINNIYVDAINHGNNAHEYLQAIPKNLVAELHLAGHTKDIIEGQTLLIDTHDQPVQAEVWQLFESAVRLYGEKPTLIEWDSRIPDLSVLLTEASTAQKIIEKCRG